MPPTIFLRITLIRENMLLFMLSSAFHMAWADSARCAYEFHSLWINPILIFVLVTCMVTEDERWRVLFDTLSVVPGVYFMIRSQPPNWWASIPQTECDLASYAVGFHFYFMGQIIVYSAAVRFILFSVYTFFRFSTGSITVVHHPCLFLVDDSAGCHRVP